MNLFISKISLGLLAVGFTTLCILLFPISRQASNWKSCVRKTSKTLNQEKATKKMNDERWENLFVMICNGAVFERKLKTILK